MGGNGGEGGNGGVRGCGAIGGAAHSSLVHTTPTSKLHPVEQQRCTSDSAHNRPPCALHSAVACANVAAEPSAVLATKSGVSGKAVLEVEQIEPMHDEPSSVQHLTLATPSDSFKHAGGSWSPHWSFARYTCGGLFIGMVIHQPAASMEQALKYLLHSNGYSEVQWQLDNEQLPTQVGRLPPARATLSLPPAQCSLPFARLPFLLIGVCACVHLAGDLGA